MEVAHIGVTTSAQVALSMAASDTANSAAETAGKRRKIARDGLKLSSSSYVQLKSQRRRILKDDCKTSPPSVQTEDSSSSPSSGQLPASCCSSNRSSEHDEERRSPVDLEVESAEVETSTCNCSRERFQKLFKSPRVSFWREMSPSNELRVDTDEQESMAKSPSEHNCHKKSTVGKMPTELEIEEFFNAAEKDIQKKFEEKYNYDIVEDVPLEGRYDWVPLKLKQ